MGILGELLTFKSWMMLRSGRPTQLSPHSTRPSQSQIKQSRLWLMRGRDTIQFPWHYTTFLSPWGRYRYRTCPQGFLASGDALNARYDKIVADFKDKTKCIDDTLLWSNNLDEFRNFSYIIKFYMVWTFSNVSWQIQLELFQGQTSYQVFEI